jgi:hypothetical protein
LNCLVFAFQHWFKCGGYLLVRKSHSGWWPHFAWSSDLKTFQSFTPAVPNHHMRFPPLFFRGKVLVSRKLP